MIIRHQMSSKMGHNVFYIQPVASALFFASNLSMISLSAQRQLREEFQ
jgi:hypothetical protein